MVVADGMGGHLHGEVAAQIAVQYITEAFQREAQPLLKDPFLFLSGALSNAHHAILDYAADRFLPEAPRTTCVACIVQDSIAYWAHAGDSRLYAIRGGRILAPDARPLARAAHGRGRPDHAPRPPSHHPARNRIFSCLGGTSAAAGRLLQEDAADDRRHHPAVHRRRLGAAPERRDPPRHEQRQRRAGDPGPARTRPRPAAARTPTTCR